MTDLTETTLRSIGITRNYRGYQYLYDAAQLVADDPSCLCDVVRKIYTVLAERYDTTWSSVERNIRTCIRRAWTLTPALIQQMAGYQLDAMPTTSQFIEILSTYLQRKAKQQ